MAGAIVERGFAASTVADVCRLAKVSRRTCYEHFASREDCYVALLALLNEQLIAHIADAVDPMAAVPVQVRQAVEAWIQGLDAASGTDLELDPRFAVIAVGARDPGRGPAPIRGPDRSHRRRADLPQRAQSAAGGIDHHPGGRPARAHRDAGRDRRVAHRQSSTWPWRRPWPSSTPCSAGAVSTEATCRVSCSSPAMAVTPARWWTRSAPTGRCTGDGSAT